ncbi:MAG: PEP-CTERM sorting domain-containing protein [Thiobacillus sp.]
MNVKLNALVVAALMAATGTAQAKIADSDDNGSSSSGDLFASVVSASQVATYTVDLGIRLDQFMAAPTNVAGVKLVWDFDNNSFADLSATSTGLAGSLQTLNYGSIWTTFAAPAVVGATDLKFDVKAMDGLPTSLAGANTNRYLSTSLASSISANNTAVFNMDSLNVYPIAANADTTHSTHTADLNQAGANMLDLGDATNVNFENGSNDNWKGQTTFTSVGSTSSPLNFFFLTNSSNAGATAATITKLDGTWSFDASTAQLTYATAPVPEAETYAMMLAGLGLVGFMVGRRNKRV